MREEQAVDEWCMAVIEELKKRDGGGRYVVVEGVLYRLVRGAKKLEVPKKLRLEVLKEIHDLPVSGVGDPHRS